MTRPAEIVVSLTGGHRVDAEVRGHVIHTDEPRDQGGDDGAPSPFEVFLSAIGACAGIFVQTFCAERGLSTEGIRLVERPGFDAQGGLVSIELELQLPSDFPVKHAEPLRRVMDQCSVKRAIDAHPTFATRVVAIPQPTNRALQPEPSRSHR